MARVGGAGDDDCIFYFWYWGNGEGRGGEVWEKMINTFLKFNYFQSFLL